MIVHADWGSAPERRWLCVAQQSSDAYEISTPEPVGPLDTLWRRLVERAGGRGVLAGFDFPIGLPAVYAERAGIQQFHAALRQFGSGAWSRFYDVAREPEEISLTRPFYPHHVGGRKQQHLLDGLGVDSMRSLLRQCDRATPDGRGPACAIFWTLGAKQVGKAAISGWRDVLAPGLADPNLDLQLWPQDGELAELLERRGIVVVETYPAEACVHLGLEPPGTTWKKTSQQGRREQAGRLLEWAANRPVSFGSDLKRVIRDGFGPGRGADDRFDSLVGLLSMLEVVLGYRDPGAPTDRVVREVEGWIFGQEPRG